MYVYKYVHYIYNQDLNSSKLMSVFFFYPERRFPGPFVLGFLLFPRDFWWSFPPLLTPPEILIVHMESTDEILT